MEVHNRQTVHAHKPGLIVQQTCNNFPQDAQQCEDHHASDPHSSSHENVDVSTRIPSSRRPFLMLIS